VETGYTPSATPLTLGVASWYSGGYFTGLDDEVAFYGRALSPLEISAIYHADGVPAADQRGYERPYNAQDSAGSLEPQPYVVINTNDQMRRVFELTGLMRVLNVVPDRAHALAFVDECRNGSEP